MRVFYSAIVFVLSALLLQSCQSGSLNHAPVEPSKRAAILLVGTEGTENFTTPVAAPAQIIVYVGQGRGMQDIGRSDFISRIEVNCGDGSGWVDITAESFNLQGNNPDGMIRHTYTEPGTYHVNARLTYWDGEVVYNDPYPWTEGYPVTVVAAP